MSNQGLDRKFLGTRPEFPGAEIPICPAGISGLPTPAATTHFEGSFFASFAYSFSSSLFFDHLAIDLFTFLLMSSIKTS